MSGVVHAFKRKTASICPICGSPMYMVYWYNKTRSLTCIKCFFGFNYKD